MAIKNSRFDLLCILFAFPVYRTWNMYWILLQQVCIWLFLNFLNIWYEFKVRKALPNVQKLSLSKTASKRKKQTDCFCLSQLHFSQSGLQSMHSTFQDTFLWYEILCVFLLQSFEFFHFSQFLQIKMLPCIYSLYAI